MSKTKVREGHKMSHGHEVPTGYRWDRKAGKAVKETRGKKGGGPTARTRPISFGISEVDEQELNAELKRLKSDRSPLLYQFFKEGLARMKSGKSKAKAPAPIRPTVVLLSTNHLQDVAMAQDAWQLGAVVITPALNTAQLRLGLADELFDSATASYIRSADAVLFGKGVAKSKNAADLKSTAEIHGRPVFASLAQLSKWMKGARA